jgi:sugar phosphate isomerase/epimerase
MKVFHASVEGAQHSAKGLDGFLKLARDAGAAGCQPSNFMLEDGKGGFLSAEVIRQKFADAGLKLDGFSAHCPFWVHTTAWTESKTMRPFLPKDLHGAQAKVIEQWSEDYILKLLDLCAKLGVRIVPMFWGTVFGWEVATGYPWGFWSSPDYDLIKEGVERFITKTAKIRHAARTFDIILAHEIHSGTAAQTASDFMALVAACDGDRCLGVNADPSHCWEGESWQTRFDLVADRVYGCHVKNHHVRPGMPLRCMTTAWPERPMQFTALDRGDLDMVRYAEQMIRIGYPQRYLRQMGVSTAPLVVEAEGAYEDLDSISSRGIKFVAEHCCFDVAAGSFEDGMGAEK